MAAALAMSVFGSLQVVALVSARIPYAMAVDGLFFSSLGRLSPRTRVPIRALWVQARLGDRPRLLGSYDTITDYAIFAVLIFVVLATASVFVFRRRMPDAERPYRTLGLSGRADPVHARGHGNRDQHAGDDPGSRAGRRRADAPGLPFYWLLVAHIDAAKLNARAPFDSAPAIEYARRVAPLVCGRESLQRRPKRQLWQRRPPACPRSPRRSRREQSLTNA